MEEGSEGAEQGVETEGRRSRGRQAEPPAKTKTKKIRNSARNKTDFLVGKPSKISASRLPTRADMLKHFLYLKEKRGSNSELKRIVSCPLGDGFRKRIILKHFFISC